jgi:hypothetical protein
MKAFFSILSKKKKKMATVSDVYDAYDTKIRYDNQHKSIASLNKNSECISVATSYTSYASYRISSQH